MYLINRHKMWNLDFEQIENGQELVTLKAEYTYNLPACWLELSAAGTAPNSLKLERLRSVEETHSKRAHQLKSADAKGSIRGGAVHLVLGPLGFGRLCLRLLGCYQL